VRWDKLADSVEPNITYHFPDFPQFYGAIVDRKHHHKSLSLNIVYSHWSPRTAIATLVPVIAHREDHSFWASERFAFWKFASKLAFYQGIIVIIFAVGEIFRLPKWWKIPSKVVKW